MQRLQASHIEKPRKPFVVRFIHQPYRAAPHPGSRRTVKIMSETPEGAIKIARYFFMAGSRFETVNSCCVDHSGRRPHLISIHRQAASG